MKIRYTLSLPAVFSIWIILAFILTGCAPYYDIFGKQSNYFTEREQQYLDASLEALEMGRGYDPEVDLDYIYAHSFTSKNQRQQSARLADTFKDFSSEEFIEFYENIFRLRMLTEGKMERYNRDVDMINYTYVKKYLSPGLEFYLDLLEEEALKRDSGYSDIIDERKDEIREEAMDQLRREERMTNIGFD